MKDSVLFPIDKVLYETDNKITGEYLASSICWPSYLSFDYALAYHGLIPEAVCTFTCASFEKRKAKSFETSFGLFTYRDVPSDVYPIGLIYKIENSHSLQIACSEKALCDKLYSLSPIANQKSMESLLFEDLRIAENMFSNLNKEDIEQIASKYRSRNVRLLAKYIRKNK